MLTPFAHVRNWIFDLDNTLYAAETNLFELIDARMGAYIAARLAVDAATAHAIQKDYFYRHGTTLSGMMQDHRVDPHEFLAFVHDIPLDRLSPVPGLARAIAALLGRKLVFTNGDSPYAERVLDRLGLAGAFEAIHDIHATAYRPKPAAEAYATLLAAHAIDPRQTLFVEDMARNLIPAKALGMTTIWLNNGSDGGTRDHDPLAIDHEITALGPWLAQLTGETAE